MKIVFDKNEYVSVHISVRKMNDDFFGEDYKTKIRICAPNTGVGLNIQLEERTSLLEFLNNVLGIKLGFKGSDKEFIKLIYNIGQELIIENSTKIVYFNNYQVPLREFLQEAEKFLYLKNLFD